jgi:hypothetical protein
MSAERPGPDSDKVGKSDERPVEYAPAGKVGDDPLTRNLKRVYADIAAEPIPDHLLSLLERLDVSEPAPDENGDKK